MLGFVSRPCLLLLKLNMSYSFYYKRWFVKWWLKEHISSEPHNLSLGSFFWVPLVSENLLSVIDVAPLSLVRSYIDDSSIGMSKILATTVERSMNQLIALVPKEIPRLTLRFFPFFDPSPFPHNPPPAAVANPFLFTDAEYGIKSDDFLIILCAEARKFLVDSYVALPRGDTTPGSRVAYSMTVRQLEALIRLLEAISRCHLDDEVHPGHVKLATRLLKTSVIRHNSNSLQTYVSLIIVESTEIDLTEFQEENQEEGDVEPQIADVDADSNNDQPGFSCKIDGAEFKTEDKKLVKDQNLHKNLISDKRTKRSQLKLKMAFDGQERDMKRFWEPSIFTLSTKMLKEHVALVKEVRLLLAQRNIYCNSAKRLYAKLTALHHLSEISKEQHRKLLPFLEFERKKVDVVSYDCENTIAQFDKIPDDRFAYGIVKIDEILNANELADVDDNSDNVSEISEIEEEEEDENDKPSTSQTCDFDNVEVESSKSDDTDEDEEEVKDSHESPQRVVVNQVFGDTKEFDKVLDDKGAHYLETNTVVYPNFPCTYNTVFPNQVFVTTGNVEKIKPEFNKMVENDNKRSTTERFFADQKMVENNLTQNSYVFQCQK
uniref:DNA helicase n=1 Tax=Lactuca sativa TaxID=4236 RepID=A0A9R1V4X1_LACSA|nr:hypothetical protein LSAT_V11C700376100 [Lactuca sativa]